MKYLIKIFILILFSWSPLTSCSPKELDKENEKLQEKIKKESALQKKQEKERQDIWLKNNPDKTIEDYTKKILDEWLQKTEKNPENVKSILGLEPRPIDSF